MIKRDPKLVTLLFNEHINNRNIDGLADLMTEDHRFIDSGNNVYAGKELQIKSWTRFFELYPDYLNHFTAVESRDNLVLITGHSSCEFEPLDGPAIWTATIRDDQIAEWRVYLDTAENRKKLDLRCG